MASTIKLKGAEAAITTTATNFSSASVIRLHNTNASTARLITLTTTGDVAIGTFTLLAGEVVNLQKDPTDKIESAHATEVLGTPIAFSA